MFCPTTIPSTNLYILLILITLSKLFSLTRVKILNSFSLCQSSNFEKKLNFTKSESSFTSVENTSKLFDIILIYNLIVYLY